MKRLFSGELSRWPFILSWLMSGSKPLRTDDPELPFPGLRDGFAPHADCGLTDAKQCGKGTDGTGLDDCVLFFHDPDCAASWLKTSTARQQKNKGQHLLAAIALCCTRLFRLPPQIASACDLLCSCASEKTSFLKFKTYPFVLVGNKNKFKPA